MPKVHCPAGVFATAIAAARAMNIDRGTFAKRMKTDPEHYYTESGTVSVNIIRLLKQLPTWGEYRWMPFEVKEQIYQGWCREHDLDPEDSLTADEFFDVMDSQATAETQPEPETEELED